MLAHIIHWPSNALVNVVYYVKCLKFHVKVYSIKGPLSLYMFTCNMGNIWKAINWSRNVTITYNQMKQAMNLESTNKVVEHTESIKWWLQIKGQLITLTTFLILNISHTRTKSDTPCVLSQCPPDLILGWMGQGIILRLFYC